MKKLFFTALYLLTVMTAAAETWTFSDGVGDDDQTNLNADSANWTYDSGNNRWKNLTTFVDAALTANGMELAFTKGLLLTATVTDGIRVDAKLKCLTLNNSGSKITIPDLSAGTVVTVVHKCSSATQARAVTATNLTYDDGTFNASGTSKGGNVTSTGTVTDDGDVVISTEGGMYFYSIDVNDGEEIDDSGGDAVSLGAGAVPFDNSVNQARVTLVDGTIGYYNTSAVTSIDFDGDTVSVNIGSLTDRYKATARRITFAKATASTDINGSFTNEEGKVTVIEAKGWRESAYITWNPFAEAETYRVYIKGGPYADYTLLDRSLVRNYGAYGRADMVGLTSGSYTLKVTPVINGEEDENGANEATGIKVVNFTREGFAFMGDSLPGAYKANGTLKDNAIVIYADKDNFNTVTLTARKNAKGDSVTFTGVQEILNTSGYNKYAAYNGNAPLDIRIIGEINTAAFPSSQWGSSAEGLQVKMNKVVDCGITIEGIGDDAVINGFGILLRNTAYVELRNFAVMNCADDCVSIDTDNKYTWAHNLDLFYGSPGGDSDQAKGDGTIDVKGDSQYQTYSFNHFWDSGKSSLCGMKSETGPNYLSYDHNWFDHSDSRHPRVRTMSVHVWNNYFDGNAKYGVGATMGSSVFVENNYFRNAHEPMLCSQQGTDAEGDGTFSGEEGGLIKACGNVFAENNTNGVKFRYITYNDDNESFDAYEVSDKSDQVPANVTALAGGSTYNNFDTDSSLMYTYTAADAADVPAQVTGWYGAGRLAHGDLTWTFTNSADDASYDVNSGLKTAVAGYETTLVGIFE